MYPNVKYELQQLERLISEGWEKSGNDSEKAVSLNSIKDEVERIKQTLTHEVFTISDERHLERYIQYHQLALIRLMDKALGFLKSETTSGSKFKNLFQGFYSSLEELLSFVEQHFAKYFDQDAKAPESYIAIARADAASNLQILQKSLLAMNADHQLVDTILYPLRRIESRPSPRDNTYRNVMYIKELQRQIFNLIDNCKAELDIDQELRLIAYYLNYNSIKCFTYHTCYITGLLKESDTRAGRIEKLSFVLKTINQVQVKPGISYNSEAASLKEQLTGYVEEEISYLERLQQLATAPFSKVSENPSPAFRLKLEISVAQLAYLIRVFLETNIIQNKNVTELLRFLVTFTVTKRSEGISYDSFRTKYYNVEKGTRDSVRVALQNMIYFIEKHQK